MCCLCFQILLHQIISTTETVFYYSIIKCKHGSDFILKIKSDTSVLWKKPSPQNILIQQKTEHKTQLSFAGKKATLRKDSKPNLTLCLKVLRAMLEKQVTEEQLQSMAERAIQEADLDKDNAISFVEFRKVRWTMAQKNLIFTYFVKLFYLVESQGFIKC